MKTGYEALVAVLVAACIAPSIAAGAVAAKGYALRTIPTPGEVQGGVATRDGAILVGQGSFGAGQQSIVRLDGGGTTTIATGFNSLSGFDLNTAGTLYVADNCGECAGATTGDTLYAIPQALTRITEVVADDHEVLAAGSIPTAASVFLLPDASVLVGDAAGNGTGRVVRVVSATATNLITGLDLVGGVTLAGDGNLRVVSAFLNPDFTTTGSVLSYQQDGDFVGTVASGLVGGFDAVLDADGNVLVSGVGPFTASKVIAIAPGGGVTDRATGFAFSGDLFFDPARDEALVLDSGASEITAICRDTDEDGACDADDACTGGGAGEGKLMIGKLLTPPGDDMLLAMGTLLLPAAPAIDPVATGVRLVVAGGGGAILDATIPGGAYDKDTRTGWKAMRGGKFSYQNPTGILGITKVAIALSSRTPGLLRFLVLGKKGDYVVSDGDLPLALTLDVGDGGECGDISFPACAFNRTGKILTCK